MTRLRGTNNAIIAETIGREPDRAVDLGGWQFARWRQFIGSYELPALVDPVFVVHVGGRPDTRLREGDHWSSARSIPGSATIVPAGWTTGWRIDGELDVVTVSIPKAQLAGARALDRFRDMRFAFSDPLGTALARQILGELYAPRTVERDAYIAVLFDALKAHTLQGSPTSQTATFPTADHSAYRVHSIINKILGEPEEDYTLDVLAAEAGLTNSHFCRVFKRATGTSPHQFVMKARLDRARDVLSQSTLSIARVAEMTGFASQSHFTRAFRQYFGQTPSDWRHTLQ